jgi:membrane-bound serine protease (ClpP class)
VIEIVAADLDALLQQADGHEVKIADATHTIRSAGATVQVLSPDWRSRILAVITDPTVAYLLLLIGLYGLVFEGYNPGAVLPGVVGAISLLLALYALQLLPVSYAGLALIVLGLALMVTEVFVPSFGVLGIGGLVALLAGSLMLFDRDVPGFEISRGVIYGFGTATALTFFIVLQLAARARARPSRTGAGELIGHSALVLEPARTGPRVRARGEIWQARRAVPLQPGQRVRVRALHGLVLEVEPEETSP